MNPIDALTAAAGQWLGTNTLQDPNTGKPEESPSTVAVTPVLGGRFVRVDYTWSYQGKPQEGSLLVGFDPESGEVSGHGSTPGTWAEKSWPASVRPPTGRSRSRAATPHLPAPTGAGGSRSRPEPLRITHTNIDADGTEDLAAEGVYSRS